jgi:tetratricopeptide (TPR) repeat protein
MIGLDLNVALELARDAVQHSRERGLVWAEGFSSTIDGIVQTVAGDVETAQARYLRGLEIQEQLGDDEGAGVSLGGLAQLAAMRGDLKESLDLYRRSLDAFEAVGDRAEEARILSETAWIYLRHGDIAQARRYFLDSVQAYTDVASVRGVGLSLIGLAAAETFEQRFENALKLAAAAELYAREEGIVDLAAGERRLRQRPQPQRADQASRSRSRPSKRR